MNVAWTRYRTAFNTTETEVIKDLADQHRALEREDDSDEPILTATGAKVIARTVNNVQVNQNASEYGSPATSFSRSTKRSTRRRRAR